MWRPPPITPSMAPTGCCRRTEARRSGRGRIRSTHLHDNNGLDDHHRYPFLHEGGTIDWRRLMELLRSCSGQFPLNLELRESDDFPQPLDSVRTVLEKLEKA